MNFKIHTLWQYTTYSTSSGDLFHMRLDMVLRSLIRLGRCSHHKHLHRCTCAVASNPQARTVYWTVSVTATTWAIDEVVSISCSVFPLVDAKRTQVPSCTSGHWSEIHNDKVDKGDLRCYRPWADALIGNGNWRDYWGKERNRDDADGDGESTTHGRYRIRIF